MTGAADLVRPWAASPSALRALLSLAPTCPRAPALAFPDAGSLGRGRDRKAGPFGPTMNCEGAEISRFGGLRLEPC